MLEVLKQQISGDMSSQQKINKVREFLQIMLLKNLYDQKAFDNIAFTGGTALRIVFDINRYSEDLDFSLIKKSGYNFEKINNNIVKFFNQNAIEIEANPKTNNIVHQTLIKFPNILQELNLAVMKTQKLSIKIEVDANPPKGWKTNNFAINKIYLLSIKTFDLPSMFATKLHACFFRKYTKGRDFYDLVWYLSKKVKLNFTLLNNAIIQTEKKDLTLSESNLKSFISDNLDKINFKTAQKDISRFLFINDELKFISKDFIKSLLLTY
ncbi:MAG: nucleotidyl transferase AbiEii/AbiGii toxin family protein [Endomicrobium sp.]|nr:nucleotidyl transferase AbiEii/AbiGii toxin family protein [Endomicrobium sp.]